MMLGRLLRTAALVVSLATTYGTEGRAAPSAQDVWASQQAFREGTVAEFKKDWREARDAFQRSIDRYDTPRARLHLARAEAKIGHLIEAFGHYQAALDSAAADYTLKAAAKKEQKDAGDRIPLLTVKVPKGFSGTVVVDDVALAPEAFDVAIQVNPGTRVVNVETVGFKPFHKSIVVLERGNAVVNIELIAAPKAATAPRAGNDSGDGSDRAPYGYVSLGAGALALVVGTGFGLASSATYRSVRDACNGNVCKENVREEYNHGKTQANVATAGFIFAGAFTALGLTLLLTTPDKTPARKPSVSLGMQPTGVAVHGRF